MTGVTGGYRNEQLYGIDRAGEQAGYFTSDGQYRLSGANNPPFIYPAREIITQDANGNVKKQHLARGYIRSLIESSNGIPVPIRKCAFQFNPQYLSTSVQMAQDVLNTFQQDIGQLNIPLAANSNFLFQLFFDRSMELNNNTVGAGDNVGGGDPENTNIFAGADALAPSQIGVFRDIGELNAVIGAGLSPDIVDFSRQVLSQQINASFNSQSDVTDTTGRDAALGKVNDFVGSVNFGNSAFLLPRPVRAVFSALFMVEGFVTNIDINYTKFTTAMVPMQATVTLTMNAQYIGYAKKRTYVTASLQQNALDYANQQKALQSDVNGLVSSLQSAAGKLAISQFSDNGVGGGWQLSDYLRAPLGGTVHYQVWVPGSANSDHTGLKSSDPVTAALDGHTASFSGFTTTTVSGPYTAFPSPTSAFTETATIRASSSANGFGPAWQDLAATENPGDGDDGEEGKYNFATPPVSDAVRTGGGWWIIKTNVSIIGTIDGVDLTGSGSTTFRINDITSTAPFQACNIPITWAGSSVPGQQIVTSANNTQQYTTPTVPKSNNTNGAQTPGATSSVGSKTTATKPKVVGGKVKVI